MWCAKYGQGGKAARELPIENMDPITVLKQQKLAKGKGDDLAQIDVTQRGQIVAVAHLSRIWLINYLNRFSDLIAKTMQRL
jgi:hypothetical protein